MPILLDSAANGPSGDVATWDLPEVDAAGANVLLVAFTQVSPAASLDLPGDWTVRAEVADASAFNDIKYGLSDVLVAAPAGPYADTFALASGTTHWHAFQIAFRGLSGASPTNVVSDTNGHALPGATNPTVTAVLTDPTTPGRVLLGYASLTTDTGAVIGAFTWPAGWTVLETIGGAPLVGYAEVAYAFADGTETDVDVVINSTKVTSEVLLVAEYAISPPDPGALIEWGDTFTVERVKEWTITRGASPELTGSSSPGSATVVLINTPDDRYNPEGGGELAAFLHDGPRLWIGVNEDGTVTFDPDKVVHGLHAGRITDLSLLPEGGAAVAPFVEIVTEDPLAWAARQKVTLADSRTRSQADLRDEVLDALGWTTRTVPAEPATLPLSAADGLALRVLDDLNAANGTRHFAKPEDSAGDWFRYYAVRRTEGLDGSSSGSLDAGSDHVTGTSGWRRSADGIINQQKASVEPIWFSPLRDVWEADEPLPTVVTGTPYVVWVEFPDFVDGPVVDVASTGGTLTSTLVPFGRTAKLTITSSSTNVLQRLAIQGHIAVRGSVASVVIDDTASQAEPRGVRAGPDLTGDYLGTMTSARGFAAHIVYRFAGSLYRPTITVVNWLPEMFALDLFDRISVTVAELSITDRVFEIVGLTLHCDLAALDADGNPVVLHTATYVLQECREQTDPGWFILGDSLLGGDDVLAY